jgi:hypothetical protein
MWGKTIQKVFGALVSVSLLLTSVGSARGAAASRQAAVPSVVAAQENRWF